MQNSHELGFEYVATAHYDFVSIEIDRKLRYFNENEFYKVFIMVMVRLDFSGV